MAQQVNTEYIITEQYYKLSFRSDRDNKADCMAEGTKEVIHCESQTVSKAHVRKVQSH